MIGRREIQSAEARYKRVTLAAHIAGIYRIKVNTVRQGQAINAADEDLRDSSSGSNP